MATGGFPTNKNLGAYNMKYIDIRIRIPTNKMGLLVEEVLPEWAVMVGYDRLQDVSQSKRRSNGKAHEGEYKPGKGTAAEAILRTLAKQPMKRFEIINKLEGQQKEKAVSSAIHNLAHKGVIVKNKEGNYERA
jgi:ribosomal protein S20